MTRWRALPVAILFALSGCSYAYDVQAQLSNGKLVFTTEKSWFRQKCVREIDVVANDRKDRAAAEKGDDDSRVAYGTYWSTRVGYHCDNRFPVVYGSRLKGDLEEGQPDAVLVSPKPLKKNVVYEVTTVTGATGYGGGRFIVKGDGTVLNLR